MYGKVRRRSHTCEVSSPVFSILPGHVQENALRFLVARGVVDHVSTTSVDL